MTKTKRLLGSAWTTLDTLGAQNDPHLRRAPVLLRINMSMSVTSAIPERARSEMAIGEILSFAYDTFCTNKVRFILTALGMVIGTASLILVVTIGLTGRQYVLNQIQAIGTNEIWAEHPTGGQSVSNSTPDPLTLDDLAAVQRNVPGVVAASPVLDLHERIQVGGGKEKDILILGVYPDYLLVRNLVLPSGRFFDQEDSQAHNKVCLLYTSDAADE